MQLHLVLTDVHEAHATGHQRASEAIVIVDHQRADADHKLKLDSTIVLGDGVAEIAHKDALRQPFASYTKLHIDRRDRFAIPKQIGAIDAL